MCVSRERRLGGTEEGWRSIGKRSASCERCNVNAAL